MREKGAFDCLFSGDRGDAYGRLGYVEMLADKVLSEHADRGGLTLVIVNRVPRAQAIYQQLRRAQGRTADNTALIHSRFRTADRRREEAVLQDTATDRIVVATQAVEAGVDVSARTMFTELAPWPSLVQRFGRCNRYGEDEAAVYWADIDTENEKSGLSLPYETSELDCARELLARLTKSGSDAGPQSLNRMDYQPPDVVRPVIRRRDLLDLFDTTPDLSGNDLDISRYVRDGEDTDVQVYWREFAVSEPPTDLHQPARDELCRVSIAAMRDFLSKLDKQRRKLAGGSEKDRHNAPRFRAWRWNPLDKHWEPTGRPYPGQVLLLHSNAGGYERGLGWTGELAGEITVVPVETTASAPAESDGYGSDPDTTLKRWVRLADHLGHVRDEAAALATANGVTDFTEVLATAGLWHDVS